VQPDRPFGRLLKAADHPQGGRLAAAGRTEQREKPVLFDAQADVVDGREVGEPFGYRLQMHGSRLPGSG
jgi:hypothetical protein